MSFLLVDLCVSELRRQERLFMGMAWKPFVNIQPRNAAVNNHSTNGDVTGRGIYQPITGWWFEISCNSHSNKLRGRETVWKRGRQNYSEMSYSSIFIMNISQLGLKHFCSNHEQNAYFFLSKMIFLLLSFFPQISFSLFSVRVSAHKLYQVRLGSRILITMWQCSH